MLKISIIEDTDSEVGYQTLLSTGSDTLSDILRLKQFNPERLDIFVNGRKIKDNLFQTPLRDFKRQETTIYITFKTKTVDPRRAS